MLIDETLVSQIREQALHLEPERAASSLALQQILEHRWFKLFVPESLGGHLSSLPAALRIFEYASWVDGSFGWAVTIGAGGGFFVPFMQPHVAQQLFSEPNALVAGSGAPTGTAVETDGGYIVNGSWKYCSGSYHATLFTASCVLQGESIESSDTEQPLIRAFAFTADQVEIIPDWQAFGLKGTDSHSIKIHNQFVPKERMFNLLEQLAYKDEPLYRYPFLPFAQASFAAVTLGISRHFLEQAASMTADKKNDIPSSRYDAVMNRITQAAERLNASASTFYQIIDESWEVIEQVELPADMESRVSTTCQQAARIALKCANEIFPYLGMAAVMEDSPINKIWRDLQTACHHSLLVNFEDEFE
ncbi:MAG: acyl-CoA dehydrogenase [Candidatus Pristimantibacillus sp.]